MTCKQLLPTLVSLYFVKCSCIICLLQNLWLHLLSPCPAIADMLDTSFFNTYNIEHASEVRESLLFGSIHHVFKDTLIASSDNNHIPPFCFAIIINSKPYCLEELTLSTNFIITTSDKAKCPHSLSTSCKGNACPAVHTGPQTIVCNDDSRVGNESKHCVLHYSSATTDLRPCDNARSWPWCSHRDINSHSTCTISYQICSNRPHRFSRW